MHIQLQLRTGDSSSIVPDERACELADCGREHVAIVDRTVAEKSAGRHHYRTLSVADE